MKNSALVITIPAGRFKTADIEDFEVINEILQGHKEAFTRLYKKYYGYIYRSMLMKLKYNKQDAEDVTLETMAKAYENLDKFEASNTFNAWITAVAKNTLIDHVRKNAEYSTTGSIDTNVYDSGENNVVKVADRIGSRDYNPEEILINNERKNKVLKAINLLENEEQKIAVKLIFLLEMTYENAAISMGLNINNVKSLIFRAKNQLGENLKGI